MTMKAKYILLVGYSLLLLYLGFKIRSCSGSGIADKPEIIPDTALFENWYDRNKTISSKNKNIQKPKIIKYQQIDSTMNSRLKGYCNILEVRKNKDRLDVLSYSNSRIMESTFLSQSNNFRIASQNGEINYSEEKRYLQYNGLKIGFGGKLDFKTGNKLFFMEAGTGLRIMNNFDLDLKMNSMPELFLMLSYNFE
jgi:hypothetical protein